MIDESEIRGQLEKQILKVLEDNGSEEVVEFFDTLCPIGGLGNFDSLNAVEVAVSLSEVFDCHIDLNCLYSSEEDRPLNLKESTNYIHSLVNNISE